MSLCSFDSTASFWSSSNNQACSLDQPSQLFLFFGPAFPVIFVLWTSLSSYFCSLDQAFQLFLFFGPAFPVIFVLWTSLSSYFCSLDQPFQLFLFFGPAFPVIFVLWTSLSSYFCSLDQPFQLFLFFGPAFSVIFVLWTSLSSYFCSLDQSFLVIFDFQLFSPCNLFVKMLLGTSPKDPVALGPTLLEQRLERLSQCTAYIQMAYLTAHSHRTSHRYLRVHQHKHIRSYEGVFEAHDWRLSQQKKLLDESCCLNKYWASVSIYIST